MCFDVCGEIGVAGALRRGRCSRVGYLVDGSDSVLKIEAYKAREIAVQ